MPLPRVRFTIRRLMIAVAIVGIAVGGWIVLARYRAELCWRSILH